MRATYRVSWVKPKEYPFMISASEICLGVTLASRDTDPKLLCSSGHKDSCIYSFPGFLAFDGVGGTLTRLAAHGNLQRPFSEQILTPKQLFKCPNIKDISIP